MKGFVIFLGLKLITLTQSRDTYEDKLFAENNGKSRSYDKNNFVINGFESLYCVHCHLHSSAVCTVEPRYNNMPREQ